MPLRAPPAAWPIPGMLNVGGSATLEALVLPPPPNRPPSALPADKAAGRIENKPASGMAQPLCPHSIPRFVAEPLEHHAEPAARGVVIGGILGEIHEFRPELARL